MSMKKTILLISAAVTLATAAGDGRALFEQKCLQCHMDKKPSPLQKMRMKAPPIFGVMFHVKEVYKDKKSAVDFIVDYIMEPSKEKAVCMPRSIKRFGLMPSMKENVTKEEAYKIAEYIYDNFPPKGFVHPPMNKGSKDSASKNGRVE